MRTETFEGWLEDKFVGFLEIGGVPITKDNCEDMFSGWLENRDVAEMMEYAEEWMKNYKTELLPKIAENLIKYADPKAQYDGLFASKLAELIIK